MKKYTAWLPALLWMGVIFLMSAAPGDLSSEQSGLLVRLLTGAYGLLSGGAQPAPQVLALLETLVRKAAHMTEYAVLAILYHHALRKTGTRRPYLAALLLSTLYAASDEFHQAFVPDRGPSPVDVMIDAAGACIGLALARLYVYLSDSRKRAHFPENG